jgi:16S rRNA (guanine(966)-N(2))-methyltransferase RsmD
MGEDNTKRRASSDRTSSDIGFGMRTHLRIVAGSLRGRKLTYTVNPALRPTPDMVREALFSILGDAVPDRTFLDFFAGTGAIGLEALSRGAQSVVFVERDPRLAGEIVRHLQAFGMAEQAKVHRADVYRWAEQWQAPSEPVTIFLGPPFPDFANRLDSLLHVLAGLQQRLAPGSILVLQSEKTFAAEKLPDPEPWEQRLYGRNRLSIWVKPMVSRE